LSGKEELIIGLDIGTTKICAVVGDVSRGSVEIIGVGKHPSEGMRKGVVVDIDQTVESIKKAVQEAELMAGCEISSAYVGIAGGHIKGINSQGAIAIKGKEITRGDINRVIDAAKAVALPMDREIIHVLTQDFKVDEQDNIQNPIGMTGVRLEANVHIISGAATSAHNIIKCANQAGLDICDVVLETLASAEAVLTHEEMKSGIGLMDFGGGTTELAVFVNGNLKHTSVLSLGGNNLSNDIAVGLRTPFEFAEKIKCAFGTLSSTMIQPNDTIKVHSIGGKPPRILSRQILTEILEPRVDEMFSIIMAEMEKAEIDKMIKSGMVITGGSAILPGMVELAEEIFDCPVRIGVPHSVSGLVDVIKSPIYSTGVGLVIYGLKNNPEKRFRIRDNNSFNKVVLRMKNWFRDVI